MKNSGLAFIQMHFHKFTVISITYSTVPVAENSRVLDCARHISVVRILLQLHLSSVDVRVSYLLPSETEESVCRRKTSKFES